MKGQLEGVNMKQAGEKGESVGGRKTETVRSKICIYLGFFYFFSIRMILKIIGQNTDYFELI